MLLALWSRGVSLAAISWLSISISLSFSLSMVSSMRDILTVFNVCGVNNDIVFFMAFLSLVLDWLLVALLMWLAEALEVVVWFVAITWLSLSISFDISMTSMDNL